MNDLVFTTSIDTNFIPGAIGLIKSIRRFYKDYADIIIFIDSIPENFRKFAKKYNVELHLFDSVSPWVNRIVYSDDRYINDSTHYYHPDFYIREGWPDHHLEREVGLKIHHLHPLNCKAYCTGYCLCVKEYDKVIHIDADAFLLSDIDIIFEKYPQPNTVIACDDGVDDLSNLEKFYNIKKPDDFSDRFYAFNAGVIFYRNGEKIKQLAKDFMFYIDSCYHYAYAGIFADQGVIRSLVAKHHILGNINFHLEEKENWNPTWNAADDIYLDKKNNQWVNRKNNKKQYIWHGAGGEKLWMGKYKNQPVINAWNWVCEFGDDRDYISDFSQIKGSLIKENCQSMCDLIKNKINNENLKIFEIGTQFGKTAIAFAQLLNCEKIDTIDIYSPSDDYPTGSDGLTDIDSVTINIRNCNLNSIIYPHKVFPKENILKKFEANTYDVVFIDGDHSFKPVLADCIVAQHLLKEGGIIIGDDYHLNGVKEAVDLVFQGNQNSFAQNMWYWKR